jgi:hypothetical protein
MYIESVYVTIQCVSPLWLAGTVTSAILCLDGDICTVYIQYLLRTRMDLLSVFETVMCILNHVILIFNSVRVFWPT